MREARAFLRAPLLLWSAPDFTALSIRETRLRNSSSAFAESPSPTAFSSRRNQVFTCDVRRRFSSRSRSARWIRFSCECDVGHESVAECSGPPVSSEASERGEHARRLARNTAFFSFATGLSRVLGLVREVVAASYFGVTGAMSAFTIAFQVPNLVRALFADSALQGAFVPVFTELLEKGERQEAFRVASTLFFLICLVLGAVTALFVLFAEPIMSVFAPGFDDQPALQDLTVNLARLMFPIVVLLALSGLVVGMLNSFEHFSVPALAPVAWNAVIIAALIGLVPVLPEDDEIYAYAIGILAGTVVQFLLPLPWLRGRGGHLTLRLDWRDERVRRVLALMLPVTIALGLINLSLAINSLFGTLVSDEAPGRDRQGVSHLPAAPGPVQHLDRHGPVPDAGALRGPRRPRRPAPHHGERRAPDLPAARSRRGADGRARRAHHEAGLPAGRCSMRGDLSSRRRRWCGG